MNTWTLIRRSLRHHARSHLGVLCGTIVGSAILVGALVVGDSVRTSLGRMAMQRLGRVEFALASGDRLFRSQLGPELAETAGVPVAPALQLPGTAAAADGSSRANRVQILGVNGEFWKLASTPPGEAALPADGVALNEPLAAHLRVQPGDTVLVRVPKPSALSRDAPLSPEEDASVALRLVVQRIVSDEAFGRFGLQANQVAPYNAFVDLALLQARIAATNRANLLLVGASSHPGAATVGALEGALRQRWQLADAELSLRPAAAGGEVELRSRRVFLDPPVADVALGLGTNLTPVRPTSGVLTYLVNELRIGNRGTPYSMVAALGNLDRLAAAAGSAAPTGVGGSASRVAEDEVVINDWLAADLEAKVGDTLQLSYFVVGAGRKLQEERASFKVRAIVPIAGPAGDRDLMPDFPGITDSENCRDWDAGIPIQTGAIRDQDEKYWDDHRGTPKAFITLEAGRKLWSNRFGNLTAVRYTAPAEASAGIERELLRALDPGFVGLNFLPVRAQAVAASLQGQDFGGLFLGFSFFLIGAALMLVALLFQFGIEQRTAEIGTLLAMGFRPRIIRRLLLAEGTVLAAVGSVLGMAGGVAYAQVMLWGLSTIWRSAVGTSALHYSARPATLVIGAVAGTLVAIATIWLTLRRQARQPARQLLAEGSDFDDGRSDREGRSSGPANGWVGAGAAVAAVTLAGAGYAQGEAANPGLFFGAGALLLIAGLAFAGLGLRILLARSTSAPRLTDLGLRNAARRRKRSLAVVGLLASGGFLIASIGVFRLDAGKGANQRSSGTGGFAWIGETSLPVVHDLNAAEGRDHHGLSTRDLAEARFVPLRVRDGDDASCLNLNRAQRPRLLGVNPELLAARGAFQFVKTVGTAGGRNPWHLLDPALTGAPGADDAVPAIGDAASIQWALGRKVGDVIPYTDERGREFRVRIVGAVANSILQGSLLVSEQEFVRRFPNEAGYRMFLIDGPSNETFPAGLTRALQDVGLEMTRATDRLAAFNAVQNTYLSTFQVLGGLGLLLGSVGLGVVVLRNVLERRGELALMTAVGFRRRQVLWLVVSEHGALLVTGLGVGVAAAAVAVLPALLAPGGALPGLSLGLTLGGVLVSGALWTWLAAVVALRGRLTAALRNE